MSSGFVPAGTNDEPVERDDEWRRVQQELEEERRRKAEIGRQDGGKSLYEVLQQNKMAKQEAFEEKIRLKNQFRSLDEDEVDFLDSVLESTRAQEAAVKRETAEQLEAFRRQREEAEKLLLEGSPTDAAFNAEEEQWSISSRKRRREKNKDLLLSGKRRKSSAAEERAETMQGSPKQDSTTGTADSVPVVKDTKVASRVAAARENSSVSPAQRPIQPTQVAPQTAAPPKKAAPVFLGLDAYSDSE